MREVFSRGAPRRLLGVFLCLVLPVVVGCSKKERRPLSPEEEGVQTFLNKEFASTFEAALNDKENSENPRKLAQLFSGKFEYNGVSSSALLAGLGIQTVEKPTPPENLTLEQIVERDVESSEADQMSSRPKLPPLEEVRFSDPLQIAAGTFRVNVSATVVGQEPGENLGGGAFRREAFKLSGVVEMVVRDENGSPRISQFRPVDIVLQSESDSTPEAGEISINGEKVGPDKTARVKQGEKLPIEVRGDPSAGTTVAVEFNFETVGAPSPALKRGFRDAAPEAAQSPRRQEDGSPPPRIWEAPDKPGLYFLGVATIEKHPLNAKTYEENGIPMTVYEGEPRRAVAIRYVTIPVQVTP